MGTDTDTSSNQNIMQSKCHDTELSMNHGLEHFTTGVHVAVYVYIDPLLSQGAAQLYILFKAIWLLQVLDNFCKGGKLYQNPVFCEKMMSRESF